jgi:hypothetical protein
MQELQQPVCGTHVQHHLQPFLDEKQTHIVLYFNSAIKLELQKSPSKTLWRCQLQAFLVSVAHENLISGLGQSDTALPKGSMNMNGCHHLPGLTDHLARQQPALSAP